MGSGKTTSFDIAHRAGVSQATVSRALRNSPLVNPETRERVQRIADELQAAGIDATGTKDLLVARWRKLMWNIPFNGLSVVLDATTKELMQDRHAESLADPGFPRLPGCGYHRPTRRTGS